jgi:hypothetical protein
LAQWDMSKSNSEESEILARINGRYPPGADDSNLRSLRT